MCEFHCSLTDYNLILIICLIIHGSQISICQWRNFFIMSQGVMQKTIFREYREETKKRHILFCSSFLNFWDMKTLILSKDRIFDGIFGETNFKMRQLLVDTHMAQNQKWQKNIFLILYPRAFFSSLRCSELRTDF